MPFLWANGTQLYYEETGSGKETLVFAHGLLLSCRMFDFQVRAFEDRYRCISFDFRSHGYSPVTAGRHDPDHLADDTLDLLDKISCSQCHFVGFGSGGTVGLRLAARQPQLLRSLILIDTSADKEPFPSAIRFRLLNIIQRYVSRPLAVNRFMSLYFSPPFLYGDELTRRRQYWREHLLENDGPGSFRAINGAIRRKSVSGELAYIGTPTLIVVGEQDKLVKPAIAERMHQAIPGSLLATIPGAGHVTPLEQPDAVNEVIEAFLEALQKKPHQSKAS